MSKKKKDLKAMVEGQLAEMIESNDEPSEGRMKLLTLGIKMLAVNAKLEENEYGDFFSDDPSTGTGSVPKRAPGPQSGTGKRANGDGDG